MKKFTLYDESQTSIPSDSTRLGNAWKNARIREHLAATCEDRRHKNYFRFGAVEIKIDHDSPVKGVEFAEYVLVSVYDLETGLEMIFVAPVSEVEFIEPTFSDE